MAGIRSDASLMHMRAMPSSLDSPNSCKKKVEDDPLAGAPPASRNEFPGTVEYPSRSA